MNSRITATAILSTFFLGQTAYAAGPAVPNQFTSGQKAIASQVNDNFQELSNRIQSNKDALSTIVSGVFYDYHNYSVPTTITSKTFSSTNVATGSSSSYIETITRTVIDASNTTVKLQRAFPLDGHAIEFYYRATPTSYDFVEERDYPPGTGTATSTTAPTAIFTVTNPVPERTSTMHTGSLFGSGSEVTTSGAITTPGIIQVMNSLVSTDTITVNINGSDVVYNDCIKIMSTRFNSTGSYGGNVIQTNLYCNGIGLVKRTIYNTATGSTGLVLLTNTTN